MLHTEKSIHLDEKVWSSVEDHVIYRCERLGRVKKLMQGSRVGLLSERMETDAHHQTRL